MLGKKNMIFKWLLSALLCISSSFAVITAEDEILDEQSETQEITEEEQQEKDENDTAFEESENLPEPNIEPNKVAEDPEPRDEFEQEESEKENGSEVFAYGTYTDGDFTFHLVYSGDLTGLKLVSYSGSSSTVIIPSEVEGTTVTHIGEEVFKNNLQLAVITIPDSIKVIEKEAFYQCSNLNTLNIPNGVEEIGSYAFYGCVGLSEITIPESVISMGYGAFGGIPNIKTAGPTGSGRDYEFGWKKEIPTSAFSGCDDLIQVDIPDTVTIIWNNAFSGCKSLSKITLPENVHTLGNNIFENCVSLKEIIIPDNVTTLDYSSFANCEALEKVILGNGVRSIEAYCFKGCTSLQTVDIPDSVQSIGDSAFSHCSKLDTVRFGKGITSLGNNSFSSCENLKSIDLPETLEVLGESVFDYCSSLSGTVTIPGTVSYIGDYAFYYCRKLTGVVLSEGITSIGEYAFAYCALSELNIPNSVVSIGEYAFTYNEIVTLKLGNSVTTIEAGAFNGAFGGYEGFYIYIPVSLKSIGENAFGSFGGATMTTVYYSGSEDEWGEIQAAEGNELLLNARKIVFNYEPEEPEDPENPEVPEEDTLLQMNGMFSFDSPAMGRLAEYVFSYDESWFFNNNEIYQHDIAKMSLRMSMASYGYASSKERINGPTTKYDGNTRIHYDTAEGAKSSSKLMVDLLKKLEFTDIWVHYPETTPDTIGYTIASKKIIKDNEEYTLVAVTTRGGGYFQEWGGNFTIGMGDEHDGFSNAGNQVYEAVKQYLTRLMINEGTQKNIKIWLSGYSRGAAAINIAAHFLTTDAKAGRLKGVTAKNIFAYGFECPQSVRSSSGLLKENCKNIFSIVNYIDIVPKVAPSEPKSWGFQRLGVTYFLPAYELLSLSEYKTAYDKMKNEYRKILAANNMENLVDEAAGELKTTTGYLYDICLKNICSKTTPYEYTMNHQDGIRHTLANFNGADFKAGKIINAAFSVFDISAFTFSVNPILLHINDIKNAHCPELCLAWMDSLTGDSNDFVYDPVYRKIIMNCPIDVEVYNEEGDLVAKIHNKEVAELESDIEVGAFIDDDEQIIISLPSYGNYRINITATDDGTMSCQIIEAKIGSGYIEKVIQYKDVELRKNEVLSSSIGKMVDDHPAEYTLSDDEGLSIQPTRIITQNEVEEYSLQVATFGNGIVIGGGRYLDGEYAKISAEPGDYFEFEGWYAGEQLVFGDPTTRICMDHNTELTACFKGISLNKTAVQIAPEETFQIESTVYSKINPEQSVTYYSANPDVAEVDENGLVTGNTLGVADIIIESNLGLTAICRINVMIEGIYIKNLDPSYTYTDTAIKPAIDVYDTGVLLTPKTDYTVTYKNNTKAYHVEDPANPTATDKKKAPQIIIKSNAKGNYKGSKTVYFSIDPVDLNDEQITVDELSVQATGKTLSPVPNVYFNGKKLKAKTDYLVSYGEWNQTDEGDHTVTITGKGNYSGERNVTVHVASSDLTAVSKLTVSSKAVKYADLTGTDFLNEIATVLTVKNGKKVVPTDSYSFEDIPADYKKVGTVRFTLVGKEDAGFYGKRTVTVKITGISLADKKVKAITGLSRPYTGEEIKIDPAVSLLAYNGTPLTEGTDYEVTGYTKNLNAGTATVIVKGINNYTGTKKVSFKITPITDPVDESRIHIEEAVYSKGGSKPAVSIDGMTSGTDYTLKYTNNTKANTEGKVLITFKGNYKGTPSKTFTFSISPKEISTVTITSKDKVYSSKANAWKSAPVLKDTDGKTLKAGVDYEKTIVYTTEADEELTKVIPAGTVVKVTVTGKGNYTGTVSTTYRILETGKDISKLTFKISNQEYTGSPVTIDEGDITSIKLGKKEQELVLGTDYEIVSYSNNLNKGTAKVTFQGIGKYGGTKTVSFKIGQRSIVNYWNGIRSFFQNLF